MKIIYMMTCAAVLFGLLRMADAQVTSPQEKMVLSLLDDYCGDSWCERGDLNNIYFHSITCFEDQNCELNFTLDLIVTDEDNPRHSQHQFQSKSCRLKQIPNLSEAWTMSGGHATLTNKVISDIDACMGV
jgi:hypothetical protein